MKRRSCLLYDPKVVVLYMHSGFAIRCCPIADSQLILELFFLHIQGDCSLNFLAYSLLHDIASDFTPMGKFI